jgi:hypothetical protein
MITVGRTSFAALSALPQQLIHTQGDVLTRLAAGSLWETIGATAVCWVVTDDSNSTMLFPVVEFGRRPYCRMQAMPDGLYADVIVQSQDETFTSLAGDLLMEKFTRYYARSNIHDFYRRFSFKKLPVSHARTLVVDISDGNWQPPDSEIRRNIRQHSEGAGAITNANSVQFDDIWKLIVKSHEARNEKPRYPRSFYLRLLKLSESDPDIRWYVQRRDEAISCSQVFFRIEDQLLYWQAYLERNLAGDRPAQGMLMHAIRDGQQSGAVLLNLGGSPGDAHELIDYKKRCGGVEREYPVIIARRGLGRFW